MKFGNDININVNELDDAKLADLYAEVKNAVVERGLWMPEAAGHIAVAGADIELERERLLGTVKIGTHVFNNVVADINFYRSKAHQIPLAQPDREQVKEWLTEERVIAAGQLPVAPGRGLIIFPRLSRPITYREILISWDMPTRYGLYGWGGSMELIQNWNANDLSGYDPQQNDAEQFVITPTAYDEKRKGTVAQQVQALSELQEEFPQLGVTSIFEGALLASLKFNQWKNNCVVRAVDLEPVLIGGAFRCVPNARMLGHDYTSINASPVQYDDTASRLQVR